MHTAQYIKQLAAYQGFATCGIASAAELAPEKERLLWWLKNQLHGEMKFMENHFDKRLNPSLLYDGAKSVIVCLLNYNTNTTLKGAFKIAKYAYGKDYHYITKQKLAELVKHIEQHYPGSKSRAFVDSAPIMEKAWAVNAGLGWIGKNTLLLNKQNGSYVFIGIILTTVAFESDSAYANDYCGTCSKCMNACPTNAIIAPRVLDSKRCISYLTIEQRSEIPEKFKGKLQGYIFGCDICQQVCPWNQKVEKHNTEAFNPMPDLVKMAKENWLQLSRSQFKQLFKHTTIERTGYKNLKRNIHYANNG